MISSIVKIFAIFVMLFYVCHGSFIGDCYDTWSRCSEWSSWGTGWLWADCNERCNELGYSGGNCVLVTAACSTDGTAYQCQCY